MKTNDTKILKLKEQIKVKKELLKKTKKFTPITNCNLVINGDRVNIHTLTNSNTIMELMVKLNSLKLSAEDLGVLDSYALSGYLITDWLEDLNSKLSIVNRSIEEKKLSKMEEKLTKLLSEDKKTELEIEEIEKMLK